MGAGQSRAAASGFWLPPTGLIKDSRLLSLIHAQRTADTPRKLFPNSLMSTGTETGWGPARAVTEARGKDHHRIRPHGALGNRSPSEFARLLVGHVHLLAPHGSQLG